jgi:hypothetical protein
MTKYKATIGSILIILLIASVITPAVSEQITADKGSILESNLEQGEDRWFATLRMDIEDRFTNESITYHRTKPFPRGYWYVELIINFDCPSDRKIELDYIAEADFFDMLGGGDDVDFFFIRDTITIINGSNPPDINETYRGYVKSGIWYWMTLSIRANLKPYEYINGEWRPRTGDSIKLKENEDLLFGEILSRGTYQNENKDFDLRVTNPFIRLIERISYKFSILKHLLDKWR